jgi:hypothetical protein
MPEKRIELLSSAYEAGVLPLYYTGKAESRGLEPQRLVAVTPVSNRHQTPDLDYSPKIAGVGFEPTWIISPEGYEPSIIGR